MKVIMKHADYQLHLHVRHLAAVGGKDYFVIDIERAFTYHTELSELEREQLYIESGESIMKSLIRYVRLGAPRA